MKDQETYLSEFIENLQKLKKYNSMMEGFLQTEFSKKKEEYQVDEFYRNPVKDFTELLNISVMISDHFIFYPQSFRTSFLVQVFSVLEHKLNEICIIHHKENRTDFSIKDLKGTSDIDRAKLYLKKACKIDFKHLDPEWNFLENLRKIRNLIVHDKAELSATHKNWKPILQFVSSNKEILGFSQNIEYMSKEEFNSFHNNKAIYNIEIEGYYCIEALINNMKSFFEKLLKELNKK